MCGFFKLNFSCSTSQRTRTATQNTHKVKGKEKLRPDKFRFPQWTRDALLQSYWTISAQGSRAWPVKIKQTLMRWTVGEQTALRSTDGQKPSHCERWEWNSVVLTRATRLTAWTLTHCYSGEDWRPGSLICCRRAGQHVTNNSSFLSVLGSLRCL